MIKRIAILAIITSFISTSWAQEEIKTHADQMPYFKGCDAYPDNTDDKRQCSNEALISFIANHIQYPDIAKENGIEGTVYVSFIIDEDGRVTQPSILRDIGSGCGEEALRVLSTMPDWEPAVDKQKHVKVKLNLPIQFYFTEEDNASLAEGYKIQWGGYTSSKINKKRLEELLSKSLFVRDQFGNTISYEELIFSFEKKNTFVDAKSNGTITKDLKKVVNKVKKGGLFTVTAVFQTDGRFYYVDKEFSITD